MMFSVLPAGMNTMNDKRTKKDIVEELRQRGYKTSFRTKDEAQKQLENISWHKTFPWHDDQKTILGWDIHDKKESVVQGVFGSGKTTLMLGIFSKLLEEHEVSATDVVFCAFNVSIKNELKKKLRLTGLKTRPLVRTFDSLVFEICREHGMVGLDKPDYEGRRHFIEKLLRDEGVSLYKGFEHTRLLLVDETQDLDYKAHDVFRSFFPDAHIFFFGDIFQCIQKEPRASLLWHVLQPSDYRRIHFMQKTPRVPTTILGEIKRALIHHYPEYTTPISNWYSSNPLTTSKIEWVPIQHYNDSFRHLRTFLQQHKPEECMVLTFSSAITVRGSMGDLCRFRQFLQKEGYASNRNYKSMDHDKLFLSTVNSSKGLERPYVFIALTFPLELAFANFSNDLVVNLVSVGLSRCKVGATFCVPVYQDRFSDVLRLYPECPKPKDNVISNKKHAKDKAETIVELLHKQHSTTEVLRQSMLSFPTRELLRSCAKYTPTQPFPPGERVRWAMRSEEEASFMGILYEVLITSLWTHRWPELDVKGMGEVLHNPMYSHCQQNIETKFKRLIGIFHQPYRCDFDILYEYTEFHILLTQKIRVRISVERKKEMKHVWGRLRKDIAILKPKSPIQKAQVNLQRNLTTGVADLICQSAPGDDQPLLLYEIKTCSNADWKDEAFTQAALYMSMTPNKRGIIRLLNPFRRELHEYHISLLSKEKKVMLHIDREMLLWNLNCFLAKFQDNPLLPALPGHIQNYACGHDGLYLEFLAATKARLVDSIHKNKTLLSWDKDNLILSGKVGPHDDLRKWLMDAVGYNNTEEDATKPITDLMGDEFYNSMLMAVYLRQSYSFR